MQLSTNEFIYEYKEGKPGLIFFEGRLFATVYCYESALAAITQFLNDNHNKREEHAESLEQQAANRLHEDKIINRATGEPY